MNSEMATKVRISGLVRSPDREGALAHFDPDRGFVLVARSSMGIADVIDPTIWVKEKISLAIAMPGTEGAPPLRRALAALRSIHAELMARSERERSWVSALVALFHDEEGAAVLAGDCSCYRFRDGFLARLGRSEERGARVPEGSLGSETQVRIEVVALRPRPGDCYVFATDPLPDGELARLSRELAEAKDDALLLRRALEGDPGRGRVALVVHRGGRDLARRVVQETAEGGIGVGGADTDSALGALTLEPLDSVLQAQREEAPPSLPVAPLSLAEGLPVSDTFAPSLSPTIAEGAIPALAPVPAMPDTAAQLGEGAAPPGIEPPGWTADVDASAGPSDAELPRSRPTPLTSLEDGRPWYEPVALWGAGALAIVALALLVRSIVPGILGTPRERVAAPPPAVAPTASIDIFSDPPGGVVRVDGVATETRTPVTGFALDPGMHRIDVDWGPFGSWSDTVEVRARDRLMLRPRVTAPVSFRSTEAARLLDVYLDGSYAGSTPLTLDSVTVGRHLVRFGAPGMSPSAQEFELLRGTPLELVGSAGAPPHPGSITVRTALLGDEGFQPGKGDPAWIDGELRGVTPLTVSLDPGAHSVRVVRRGYPAQVSVLDVRPGGEHFVTAEFGAHSEDPVVFSAPLSLSIQNPAPLTITLPEAVWDEAVTVWLNAAPLGGSFQARSMTPLDAREHTYAALVPREVLVNARHKVRVYFRVSGASGREYCSEIHSIAVKN
jgi:hypothetical protein